MNHKEEKQFQLPEEVEKRFQDLEKKKDGATHMRHQRPTQAYTAKITPKEKGYYTVYGSLYDHNRRIGRNSGVNWVKGNVFLSYFYATL
jgi:hypothetical protein